MGGLFDGLISFFPLGVSAFFIDLGFMGCLFCGDLDKAFPVSSFVA